VLKFREVLLTTELRFDLESDSNMAGRVQKDRCIEHPCVEHSAEGNTGVLDMRAAKNEIQTIHVMVHFTSHSAIKNPSRALAAHLYDIARLHKLLLLLPLQDPCRRYHSTMKFFSQSYSYE
jgi:hypothetical protein